MCVAQGHEGACQLYVKGEWRAETLGIATNVSKTFSNVDVEEVLLETTIRIESQDDELKSIEEGVFLRHGKRLAVDYASETGKVGDIGGGGAGIPGDGDGGRSPGVS